MDRFTWQKVAERHWGYCQAALKTARKTPAARLCMRAAAEREHRLRHHLEYEMRNRRVHQATWRRVFPHGQRFAIFANRPWEELVRPDEAVRDALLGALQGPVDQRSRYRRTLGGDPQERRAGGFHSVQLQFLHAGEPERAAEAAEAEADRHHGDDARHQAQEFPAGDGAR